MESMYYTIDDLQAITGRGYVTCYKLISQINSDLKAEGKVTFKGQVLKEEFNRRIGVKNEA